MANAQLAGRRILLGVSGGVAAYKSAELARELTQRGAEVQVVMSAAAEEFIAPLTFQALTGREVRTSLFDPAHEAAMGHIELARWADLILIAPGRPVRGHCSPGTRLSVGHSPCHGPGVPADPRSPAR